MKGWWRRKRKEPRDRHREFIYLDEVSVVSLLAALEGEIKQSVTNTPGSQQAQHRPLSQRA